MTITADFGLGASGGLVVNDLGEIVGMVSAIQANYSGGGTKHKGDLQLLLKIAIPVSQLNKHVKEEVLYVVILCYSKT